MNKNSLYSLIAVVITNILVLGIWYSTKGLFEYANPKLFLVLCLIPLLSIHYFFFSDRNFGRVKTSSVKAFQTGQQTWLSWLRHGLFALRMIAFALIVIALARPQSKTDHENMTKEGIDIVLAMDVSGSMLSKDFNPNRLESSKKVAIEFVEGRPDDRIGLVVYEGESYTQVPLTTDHRVVRDGLATLETGLVEGGTAIGMGLATAVNRLKKSESKSKVIILLTDGVNNQGQIKPLDAARIAKAFNIRVYTIGVGSTGRALTPVAINQHGKYQFDWMDVEIDEEILQQISEMTDGMYFRATSEKKLKGIYKEINALEKTKFNVTQYSHRSEEFFWFVAIGILLLGLEFFLRNTLFRTVH